MSLHIQEWPYFNDAIAVREREGLHVFFYPNKTYCPYPLYHDRSHSMHHGREHRDSAGEYRISGERDDQQL